MVRDGGEGRRQRDEAAAGDACRALGGQQQHGQDGQGLGHGERRVGGLGHEDCRHGEVDGGAVQVEGVAGGDDQADHRFGAAELFQLDHHARQRRLGGGGAQHDEQLFLDVAR